MQNLLPKSIEMRALDNMANGMGAIEAVKKAIEDENNTIWLAAHGVDMKTGRMRKDISDAIKSEICTRVYNKINNL